jgi:hypothetical protein
LNARFTHLSLVLEDAPGGNLAQYLKQRWVFCFKGGTEAENGCAFCKLPGCGPVLAVFNVTCYEKQSVAVDL